MKRHIFLGDSRTPIALPDRRVLEAGNTSTAGVWQYKGGEPGPTVLVTSLIHGNEIAGALACAAFVAQPPAIKHGTLIIAFCNLKAYEQIEDANKEHCRWFAEDMNRVWGRIDTPFNAQDSYELNRAKELKAWIDQSDVLLDLHSMHTSGPALGLVGTESRNVEFAKRIAQPQYLIADKGHAAGKRLIDLDRFTQSSEHAVAMLVECGLHFEQKTLDTARSVMEATVQAYLGCEGIFHVPLPRLLPPQILVEVTDAVTINSHGFAFTQDCPNMAQIPEQGSCIAKDGDLRVTTPYADAWLVMPAPPQYMLPGMTAVRFGRTVHLH